MTIFTPQGSNSPPEDWEKAFGRWLREVRSARGLDMRVVAAAARVSPSTISRTETGSCSLTLGSAIGIFTALELSPAQFWQISLKAHPPGKNTLVISGEETLALAEQVISEPGAPASAAWSKTLAQSLKQICGRHGVSKAVRDKLFTPDNIQFFTNPPACFQCNLGYPAEISSAHILEIYRRGGALLPEDSATYIRSAIEGVSPAAVAPLDYVLHHALEANPLQVKLKNLFELDRLCLANGTLVLMGWAAAALGLVNNAADPRRRLARVCTLILRWEQVLDIEDGGLSRYLQQQLRGGITTL